MPRPSGTGESIVLNTFFHVFVFLVVIVDHLGKVTKTRCNIRTAVNIWIDDQGKSSE